MCLNSNISSWIDPINYKLTIEFHTGTEAKNYEDLAKAEHFSALEMEVCLRFVEFILENLECYCV
jgi:hypothetical protein